MAGALEQVPEDVPVREIRGQSLSGTKQAGGRQGGGSRARVCHVISSSEAGGHAPGRLAAPRGSTFSTDDSGPGLKNPSHGDIPSRDNGDGRTAPTGG